MTEEGLRWQIGVWDKISKTYETEIDRRFSPVVQNVLARAKLASGERVLDLGTGTGAVAWGAATAVGAAGHVTGVDISPQMIDIAREQAKRAGVRNATFLEGRAEKIPVDHGTQDVVLASLSLMYAIDRSSAANEIARVLKPGGRFVAAVWADAEACDIVKFQQTAGKSAPKPPVAGVGPGALADPSEFLAQLDAAGIQARVETERLGFHFADFETAWAVLAGVTTAGLAPHEVAKAKKAVQDAMWSGGTGAREFRNGTHFIVGSKRA